MRSGSLRVQVCAGKDVLTGKDRYLTEIIQHGPDARDVELLESFNAVLRRCRNHCGGKPKVRHYTASPFERIAARLRTVILNGELVEGTELPPMKELATTFGTAVATVHRAVALLKTWGHVEVSRGRRAVVLPTPTPPVPITSARQKTVNAAANASNEASASTQLTAVATSRQLVDVDLVSKGNILRSIRLELDPVDSNELRLVLNRLATRSGASPTAIPDLELQLRKPNTQKIITTFADLLGGSVVA